MRLSVKRNARNITPAECEKISGASYIVTTVTIMRAQQFSSCHCEERSKCEATKQSPKQERKPPILPPRAIKREAQSAQHNARGKQENFRSELHCDNRHNKTSETIFERVTARNTERVTKQSPKQATITYSRQNKMIKKIAGFQVPQSLFGRARRVARSAHISVYTVSILFLCNRVNTKIL